MEGVYMFNNIGKKLMNLAKVLFWVVAIAALIAGILSMRYNDLLGILILIGGFITAWLSNLGLYAFGQIVDDTHAIREQKEKVE